MDKKLEEAIRTLVAHAKSARQTKIDGNWISNLKMVAQSVEDLLPKEEVKTEEQEQN